VIRIHEENNGVVRDHIVDEKPVPLSSLQTDVRLFFSILPTPYTVEGTREKYFVARKLFIRGNLQQFTKERK
jgi:hypothetical protein